MPRRPATNSLRAHPAPSTSSTPSRWASPTRCSTRPGATPSSCAPPVLVPDPLTDTLLGDLSDDAPAACDQLAPGASCTFNVVYTVQVGDPDPLLNTATAHYHPDGFDNDITDSDGHSVNLFYPSVVIDKTGTTLSTEGDDVTYPCTISNTSSSDTPDLLLDSLTDTLLGDLSDDAPAACDQLAPGASCTFNVVYTVQVGDPDPLLNTATAHYHPDGFDNDITDSEGHSVNMFYPSVVIDKTGTTLSKEGDDVTYTFTIS